MHLIVPLWVPFVLLLALGLVVITGIGLSVRGEIRHRRAVEARTAATRAAA